MDSNAQSVSPSEQSAFVPALDKKLLGFCRMLRHHRFTLGLKETTDAYLLADWFLLQDFQAFRDGMRGLLCNGQEQISVFNRLFDGYWAPEDATQMRSDPDPKVKVRGVSTNKAMLQAGEGEEPPAGKSDKVTTGGSDMERLRRLDFSELNADDQARMDALADRLWRRLATRLARRMRGPVGKRRLNFKRTVRRNLSLGGDPVHLIFEGKRQRKPRLTILLDVSGSMALYSFMLLRLLHALQQRFKKVETFVFSTHLEPVTDLLAGHALPDALAALSQKQMGWQGGTNIGASLQQLVAAHEQAALTRDTIFIILSDGLDTGKPNALSQALQTVRSRVYKVVWLNPLLGLEGYKPEARGMREALPLVDVFASAHSLESLLDIEKHLVA